MTEVWSMSTAAIHERNRINGSKGRGAITPHGKRRASLNALKHGFHSRALLLFGEDPREFERLKKKVFAETNPVGIFESFEVEQILDSLWKIRRADRAFQQFANERIRLAAEAHRARWRDLSGEPVVQDEFSQIVDAEFSTLTVCARDTNEGLRGCLMDEETQAIQVFREAHVRKVDRHLTNLKRLQTQRAFRALDYQPLTVKDS